MRSVAVRSEGKRLRTGQASLLDQRARKGVEHHVNFATEEGVSVELLHHVSPHLEDELQVLLCKKFE